MADYTDAEKSLALEMIANLKVVRLSQIVNIIAEAQKRGAFKAEEMVFVGGVHDDLKNGVIAAHNKAREELKEKEKLEPIPEGEGEGEGEGEVNEKEVEEVTEKVSEASITNIIDVTEEEDDEAVKVPDSAGVQSS